MFNGIGKNALIGEAIGSVSGDGFCGIITTMDGAKWLFENIGTKVDCIGDKVSS